jgi:hypothetical protein
MVVHKHIREHLDYQVVGLPGATPGEEVIERLKGMGEIWLGLDPGCETSARRIQKAVPQVRVMNLPDKPDDAFINGAMDYRKFKNYMDLAK